MYALDKIPSVNYVPKTELSAIGIDWLGLSAAAPTAIVCDVSWNDYTFQQPPSGVDFFLTGGVNIDVSNLVTKALKRIKGVWIDNKAVPFAVILVANDTGQQINIDAFKDGFFPILSASGAFTLYRATPSKSYPVIAKPQTKLIFTNTQLPANTFENAVTDKAVARQATTQEIVSNLSVASGYQNAKTLVTGQFQFNQFRLGFNYMPISAPVLELMVFNIQVYEYDVNILTVKKLLFKNTIRILNTEQIPYVELMSFNDMDLNGNTSGANLAFLNTVTSAGTGNYSGFLTSSVNMIYTQ